MHLCEKLPAERLHTNFCRYLLYVNRKATNIAVRAELGRRPLFISLAIHSFKYWLIICDADRSTFAYIAYLESYNAARLHAAPGWAMYIKQYCDQFDLSDTWCSQGARYKHKIARVLNSVWTIDMTRTGGAICAERTPNCALIKTLRTM